jgi:hypothetical protein
MASQLVLAQIGRLRFRYGRETSRINNRAELTTDGATKLPIPAFKQIPYAQSG